MTCRDVVHALVHMCTLHYQVRVGGEEGMGVLGSFSLFYYFCYGRREGTIIVNSCPRGKYFSSPFVHS